jgi:hypothetical protein
MKRTLRILGLLGCVAATAYGGACLASDFEAAFIAAESGDYTRAAAGWDRLAQSGNAEAQFNLGLIYHSGAAGPIDEAEAVRWYQVAAENGYAKAQEFLAVAYTEGWFGLSRDVSKADYWIRKLERGM